MHYLLLLILLLLGFSQADDGKLTFEDVVKKEKKLVFSDDGDGNWQEKWHLDGTRAKVKNTESGMEFIAGPEFGNDTSHAVLWAKENFEGNLLIEYEYTRTDTTRRCVNILYFMASGKDVDGFDKDIFSWNERRVVPHMRTYFNNMHAYHISYAAYGVNNTIAGEDYIRMRRYMPLENKGLKNTGVKGDYFNTGLFKTGETFLISVVKYDNKVWMNIESKSDQNKKLLCEWDVRDFPDLDEGRIGLRHMYTRSARYNNFKVWKIRK